MTAIPYSCKHTCEEWPLNYLFISLTLANLGYANLFKLKQIKSLKGVADCVWLALLIYQDLGALDSVVRAAFLHQNAECNSCII